MCAFLAGAAALLLAAGGRADIRAARLRHVLTLPEATLDRKMALTMGLEYDRPFGYVISRERPDLTVEVGALRKSLRREPTAAAYDRLGALYDREGQHTDALNAYRRSAALYRLRLARRPDDTRAAASYSLVLLRLGSPEQAEAALQNGNAGSAAVQAAHAKVSERLADACLEKSKAPDRAVHAQAALDAAAAFYDRAIRLTPNDPALFAQRAGFRTFDKPQMQARIDALRPTRTAPAPALISTEGTVDYERAAQLCPREPYAVVMPSWIDVVSFALLHHTDMADRKNVPLMSQQARQRARTAVLRLKTLTGAPDRRLAAKAWTGLAWVQFEFYGDGRGAERSLVRALSQDPSRQDAADYLLHVPAVVGDYPLLAAVCRRELKRDETPRLHVILAYAEAKRDRFAEARRQLEIARAHEPHDGADALALAALRMKSVDPDGLEDAGLLLVEAAPGFTPAAPPGERSEYEALCGIYDALKGHAAKARKLLILALRLDPADRPAKAALALMPEPPMKGTR